MVRTVNNLKINLENLARRTFNIEFVVDNYHEWKDEKKEFTEYLHKKAEERTKNRTSDNISDK